MINNKIREIVLKEKNKNGEEIEKKYTFQMTNRSILKIDALSGNYGNVVNGIIKSEELYSNSLILLASTCREKEWSTEELLDCLTPEQINFELVNLAMNIYFDYLGINQDDKKGDYSEKN